MPRDGSRPDRAGAESTRRDRRRLVIGYRRKYLESLVRQGEEEAGKIAQEYRQASAHRDREYAETAAALAEKIRDRRALADSLHRGAIPRR